jgi:hypothetical protein
MEPVVLEPGRVARVASGAVRLSFDLPRFGISLLTLEPSSPNKREASSTGDAGCSCGRPAPARAPLSSLLALSLVVALSRRRRFAGRVRPEHS